jgi:hypothetical protein
MNDFTNRYPQYADIAEIIRQARAERAAAMGELIAAGIEATIGLVRNGIESLYTNVVQYRSRHAADAGYFAPGPAHR